MISSKNLLRSVSYRVQIKCFHMSSLGPVEFQTNETATMLLFQTKFSGSWILFYANDLFTLYWCPLHSCCYVYDLIYTIYSFFEKKVVGKSASDNPERHWVVLSSLFFREIWKNWHERPWKCVCKCWRKATKVGSTVTVVRNSVSIISHITFRDCRVHIFPTTFLEIAHDVCNWLNSTRSMICCCLMYRVSQG